MTPVNHVGQDTLGQRHRSDHIQTDHIAINLKRCVNRPSSLRPAGVVHKQINLKRTNTAMPQAFIG